MKHWKLTVIVVVLAIILPISGIFLYTNFSSAQVEETPVAAVEDVATQEPQNDVKTVELTALPSTDSTSGGFINVRGKIVSDGNVRLSSAVSASVKEILFTQGQQVKKGDVLVRLGGDNEAEHNLQLAYEQAILNQSNLKRTLQNTQSSTSVLVRQAEQQGRSLDVSLDQLNTTLGLTRNAGSYTVQGAEIGLNNLQNSLNRTQSLRDSNANQLDLTGEQAQEIAGVQARNTAISLLTTLKGAYEPLVSGLSDITDDRDFNEYSDEVNDIIEALDDFDDDSSTRRINDRLADLTSVLYDLLDLNENVAEDIAAVTDPVAKPLATSLTQVSSALTNGVTVAVTQLSATKNQLESLPNTTGIQLKTLDSQIAGLSDQLRSLQTTIEQARNGTELQAQAINAQIQGMRQQKVSANLAIEAARIAAKSQLDTVNGQLDIVSKQVEQARNALDQLEVVSPIDGYIVDVPVALDEDVTIGRELVTVYATNVLFVRASVAPADRESIAVDDLADLSISTASSTGKVGAKIIRIAPVADANGQIPVDLAFIATDLPASFVPGITVQGQLPKKVIPVSQSATTLFVPMNAVKLFDGKSYVYVYQNGQAVEREVVLGPSDNGKIFIVSGVDSGERIIISDVSQLDSGVAVNPANE